MRFHLPQPELTRSTQLEHLRCADP